jgi:hypothetical protein
MQRGHRTALGARRTIWPSNLVEVGRLAGHFAQHYGTDWAWLAGRWHDLGKYRPRFQHYIRQASGFEADVHIRGEAGSTARQSQRAKPRCIAVQSRDWDNPWRLLKDVLRTQRKRRR